MVITKMFSADNKENNAKSSTEDKSTNKTFARRSVLKEFDPFYSSPRQNVNKPTAINEEYEEEENVGLDDITQVHNKLENSNPEDPLIQVNVSKQDFEGTPKTSRESTESLREHFEINLQEEEHPGSVSEFDNNLENDYCVVINNCSVECIREAAIMETTEKSVPESLLQASTSEQNFAGTSKTSHESTESLPGHFEIKKEKLQDEDFESVKEAYILENDYCAYINYTPDKNCSLECVRDLTEELAMLGITENVPENQTETLSTHYFECQEPIPNDIVFVNTHFDGTFDQTQNMEAFDPLGGSFINKTADHLDQDSVYEECLDTSFPGSSNIDITENEEILEIINRSFEEALDGNDVEIEDNNSQDLIFGGLEIVENPDVNCDGVLSIKKQDTEEIGYNMEKSQKVHHEDDSFAAVNFKEIEVNPDEDCEGTDDKSTDGLASKNQQRNASFGVEETEKSCISEASQDVEEANAKPMDKSFEANQSHNILSFEVNSNQGGQETNFEAKRTAFEEVCDDQHQHASILTEEACQIPKVATFEAKSPGPEVVSERQHKNACFVIEEKGKIPEIIISEATEVEVSQNVNDKLMDTTFERKYEAAEDQPKDKFFEDSVQNPKDVISEAVEADMVHDDQHENATFVTEVASSQDIISEAIEVEVAQNVNDKPMDVSFLVEDAIQSSKEDIFEAEIGHDGQHENATFVSEVDSSKAIISETTEVEVAQNVNDKPMDTTFEGKNEAAEITHEDQPRDVSFVVENAVQSPKGVIFEAEIVADDQHENATFVTEETSSKDITSEVEVAQNVNHKPVDTTFEGKNEAANTTLEDQPRDVSFVVKSAVQSPKHVNFEAEIVADDQHENATFVTEETGSKDIIYEATKVEVAQNVNDKLMDTTFEGKNETAETTHEDQPRDVSVVIENAVQSPEDVIFEAETGHDDQHENATFVSKVDSSKDIISEATEVQVAQNVNDKPTDSTSEGINEAAEDQPKHVSFEGSVQSPEEAIFEAEIVHACQNENATFVTEETVEVAQNVNDNPMDKTFEGKNEAAETTHKDQPKNVSFVVEDAVQSSEEVIFEAENDQQENATSVTEAISTKDIISEATEVELAQNVTDKRMDASFVVEKTVHGPNEVTTHQGPEEIDDEPMDITIKAKNISSSPEIATHVKSEEPDEPMETSIVSAEVSPTETYDEPMDVSFETDDAVKEVAVQETITKPTFEAETTNPRVSFNVDTASASFVISDEHAAESTKCAEVLAQSLNQTIDVEESAIVDDIDAIDNFNVTLEAVQTSEDKPSEIQIQVEKQAEIVEAVKDIRDGDAKSDNSESLNAPAVDEILEDSNKLVSPPKPKRLECRPNIRPLRNKTQVIDNPIIFQQTVSDGNLVFELNLLQTELKRIQEDNAKKDQSILAHAMNRQAAQESIRKYEHITREYHNHVKKQSEDLKLMRRRSDQVAANLTNTEMAFSVVFKNYEKAKSAIESFKKNESILIEEINKIEDKLNEVNLECKLVEDKCQEDIKMVQEQANQKKEAYQQNLNKLRATVKRLKIKASSLESSLKQKTEECQALATLCDDILKEKPSTVS